MRRTLAAGLVASLLAAPVALGDSRTRSATRDGMTLTVTPATGLDEAARAVRVTGRGYDVNKGIYVAFCVDKGPGKTPSPCGGGQDQEGTSGSSAWISSFPPYYGTGLAQPYGEGGTFDVTIRVQAKLNDEVDCRTTRCAVVTRADHTASDDRSLDVAVPVDFTTTPGKPSPAASTPVRSAAMPASRSEPSAGPGATATIAPIRPSTTVTAGSALPSDSDTADQPTAAPPEVAAAERSEERAGVGALTLLGLVMLGVVGAIATTLVLRRRSST